MLHLLLRTLFSPYLTKYLIKLNVVNQSIHGKNRSTWLFCNEVPVFLFHVFLRIVLKLTLNNIFFHLSGQL